MRIEGVPGSGFMLLYPQGNSPWYPLDKRLVGPQNRSRRGGEDINSHPLSRFELFFSFFFPWLYNPA
jgi:hypothetical protein